MLGLSSAQADQLQTLALAVFTKNSPLDPQALPQAYLDCLEQVCASELTFLSH